MRERPVLKYGWWKASRIYSCVRWLDNGWPYIAHTWSITRSGFSSLNQAYGGPELGTVHESFKSKFKAYIDEQLDAGTNNELSDLSGWLVQYQSEVVLEYVSQTCEKDNRA